jgi:hypothetical protein
MSYCRTRLHPLILLPTLFGWGVFAYCWWAFTFQTLPLWKSEYNLTTGKLTPLMVAVVVGVIYQVLAFLFAWSYFRTQFTDPGGVPSIDLFLVATSLTHRLIHHKTSFKLLAGVADAICGHHHADLSGSQTELIIVPLAIAVFWTWTTIAHGLGTASACTITNTSFSSSVTFRPHLQLTSAYWVCTWVPRLHLSYSLVWLLLIGRKPECHDLWHLWYYVWAGNG